MQSDPLSLRIGILWRVVIPIALVALVIGATLVSIENWQCRAFCDKKGFSGARYAPAGRAGAPHLCHCLTEAESKVKGRVPMGTQVFPWGQ
jgi:hypothetical protein